MNKITPQWLKSAVSQGIAGLVLLRLPNQPPEEMITKTAQVWLLALNKHQTWHESEDKWRIEDGFARLYGECDRFPNPKMLLERMPKRKPPLELPPKEMTDEDWTRQQANIKRLKERLKACYTKTTARR